MKPPPQHPHDRKCLVLGQVSGEVSLRNRVPAALRRALEQLHKSAADLLTEYGGTHMQSPAIGHLSVWEDVNSAIEFARSYQTALLTLDWPTTLLLRPEASEVLDQQRGPTAW